MDGWEGGVRVRRAVEVFDVGWDEEVERTLLGVSGKGGGSVSDLRGGEKEEEGSA